MSNMWMVIRASGLVAYGLLAASVILGLAVSSRLFGRTVPPKGVTDTHEALKIASLLATGAHVVALVLHDFVPFGWKEVLVPGASSWEPQAVALGVVAMWGTAVVTLSFYVRALIGRRAWRVLHYGAFGMFVAALLHGVAAGTDTQAPAVLALYLSTGGAVAILMVGRVVLAATGRARVPAGAKSTAGG